MGLRELANDLTSIESRVRSLRLIINIPITQRRELTNSEKEKVKAILTEIVGIIGNHLKSLE
jgi:uncharacterized protein YcgL (UPF0745 family)